MNGKHINKLVHRLVAQTFIPNLNNFPEVNHKNCVRDDNYVTNLEWCSRKYNRQYREKHGVSQTESTGHPLFIAARTGALCALSSVFRIQSR